jgi:hypothetical protein
MSNSAKFPCECAIYGLDQLPLPPHDSFMLGLSTLGKATFDVVKLVLQLPIKRTGPLSYNKGSDSVLTDWTES